MHLETATGQCVPSIIILDNKNKINLERKLRIQCKTNQILPTLSLDDLSKQVSVEELALMDYKLVNRSLDERMIGVR